MKNTRRKRFVGVLAGLVGITAGAQAETVTLTATDTNAGDQSFTQTGHWSNGLAPINGNDYVVSLQWLRTPYSADATFSFGGDSLTITNGGGMIIKSEGHSYVTIEDFRLVDGGVLRSGANPASSIWEQSGKITVIGSGEILADQSTLIIRSNIEGSGDLTLSGSSCEATLSGTNAMTGDIIVSAGTKTFAEESVSFFTLGESGENNAIIGSTAVFNGTFIFDLSSASTSLGNSWEITTEGATFGDSFVVADFLDNEDGTWYLEGASANYKFYEASGKLMVVTANVLPVMSDEESPSGSGVHPNAVVSALLIDGDPEFVLTDMVELKINGNVVDAEIYPLDSNVTNVVSYAAPSAYASGSTNEVELVFLDSESIAYTSSWSFVVSSYSEISADYAYSLDAKVGASRGYWFRDVGWGVTPDPKINWDNFPSDALAALLYDGDYDPETDVSNVEFDEGAYDFSDSISVSNVVNFSDKLSDLDGWFDSDNGWAEDEWPSLAEGNFAAEILGYVELEPGIYTFGLGCDWGTVGLWMNDTPSDFFGGAPWLQVGDRGADALGTIEVTQAGLYPIRIVFNRRNSDGDSNNWGCAIEFWTVNADGTRVLVNDTDHGGVPMWRAEILQNAYTKNVTPAPGSSITPSQNINVTLGGDFDSNTANLSLNGTPIGPIYSEADAGADIMLDENYEVTGVQIVSDEVLLVNETNTLQLVYADLDTGIMTTNSWWYDVANYIEFLSSSPSGILFTNATQIDASIVEYVGTLNTDTLVLKLDGVPVDAELSVDTTNMISYEAFGLEGGEHTVELIFEANEGGGFSTNNWSFMVHPTTENRLWNINMAGVQGNTVSVSDGVIAVAPSAGENLWNNLFGVSGKVNTFTDVTDANGENPIGFQSSGSHTWGVWDAAGVHNVNQEMFQGGYGANAPMNTTNVLSGLNPDSSYDIYLYSTWRWTENAVAYEVIEGYGDDLSASVSEARSAVVGTDDDDYTVCVEGANYDVLSAVTPTPEGIIVFTGVCSDGVLSGMQIVENPDEGSAPDVLILSASPVNGGLLDSAEATLQVVMADISVTVSEVQLLLDGELIPYDSLDRVGSTTTVSYVASDLSIGEHTFGAIAMPGGLETNEWTFAYIGTPVDTAYALWNVNFAGKIGSTQCPVSDGSVVRAPSTGGNLWNNLAGAVSATNTFALADASGANGIHLETSGPCKWDIYTGNNMTVELFQGWAGANVPADYDAVISGLDASATYDLYVYSTWGWTENVCDYQITEGNCSYTNTAMVTPVSSNVQGADAMDYSGLVLGENYYVFVGVTPSEAGLIAMHIGDGATDTICSGFQLVARDAFSLGPVSGPMVSVSLSAGGPFTLSWPNDGYDYTVLTNADLTDESGWGDAGLVPYVVEDNNVITNTVSTESSLFYKLEYK